MPSRRGSTRCRHNSVDYERADCYRLLTDRNLTVRIRQLKLPKE